MAMMTTAQAVRLFLVICVLTAASGSSLRKKRPLRKRSAATLAPIVSDQYCRLFGLKCSANDITIGGSPSAFCVSGCGGTQTCSTGDTIYVNITESISFTAASARYDFVYTSRSINNSCAAEVGNPLVPPSAQLDGDQCGDILSTNLFTYTLSNVPIPCVDKNGDNFVDWDVCFGYASTAEGGSNRVCNDAVDAVTNQQKPKCKCATVQLPIAIRCSASTCPAYGTSGVGITWPTPSNTDCLEGTVRCLNKGSNCTQDNTGLCVPNRGSDGSLSCFYPYKNNTVVCRSANGECDVDDLCNGTSIECGANGYKPAGTPCRPVADLCDVAENCTGGSPDCPTDGFLPSGTVCRAAVNCCDVQEVCSGSSKSCPDNAVAGNSTVCLQYCDLKYYCKSDAANCSYVPTKNP